MYHDKRSAEQLADQVIRIESYAKKVWGFITNRLGKVLFILILISFVSVPRYAFAQECSEPIPVTTPCTGVLLPPEAAEKGLKCLRVDVPRLQLDLDFLTKEKASMERMHLAMMSAEQNRNKALEDQIEFLLKTNTAPRWYESPAFHFAIGFVTASAVTIGITYAVNND